MPRPANGWTLRSPRSEPGWGPMRSRACGHAPPISGLTTSWRPSGCSSATDSASACTNARSSPGSTAWTIRWKSRPAWCSHLKPIVRRRTGSPQPGSRRRSWSPRPGPISSRSSRPRNSSSQTSTDHEPAGAPAAIEETESMTVVLTVSPEDVSSITGWFSHDLLIGGGNRAAETGERFDVVNPATGGVIASVASASVQDSLDAVTAAGQAMTGWARLAPRVRAEVLRRAFEIMTERAEDLARLIVLENGKSLVDARGEVSYAAEFFRWYSEEAVRLQGGIQRAPNGANRILVTHQPIGVSVLVTPWNFPAAMATRKIAPALAAGCAVVLKPASDTPLTALAIGALLAEAGVPDGVVNVLPSRSSGTVVSAMLHDPRVRKLSFTGSIEVLTT